ncbi:MAG: methyltransferase domain-containing protein [Methylosarcina sp.]
MNSFHGKVSPLYLAQAATLFLPLKMLSYERMKIDRGDHVLDIGCGPGTDVLNLAERISSNGMVTGFDYDGMMLNKAMLVIRDKRLSRCVSLIQGDSAALPFQDNNFDSCRSERLFMHLVEPGKTLSEIIRVTKPGGRIVIVDTDWSSLSIDNPLPRVERALSDYRINHVLKNGYSGRSLYRQFKEHQLSDIKAEVFPICITDIKLFYFISMQQAVEDQALADRFITRQELSEWRNELNESARHNSFYSSASVVMISATKPE